MLPKQICWFVIFLQVQKWIILEKDFSIPGGELGKCYFGGRCGGGG